MSVNVSIDFISEAYRNQIYQVAKTFLQCKVEDCIILQNIKNIQYIEPQFYKIVSKSYLDFVTNQKEGIFYHLKSQPKYGEIDFVRYNDNTDIYIVRKNDYVKFCRFLRLLKCETKNKYGKAQKPILCPNIEKALDDYILEFFTHKEIAKQCGVKLTRSVVLSGEPGIGKSMYLKYLKRVADEKRLSYHCVNYAEMMNAVTNGTLDKLFHNCNIICFDDVDIDCFDRRKKPEIATSMLSAMDGPTITAREPVLRVFTTNETLKNIDEAFVRYGRIDKIITLEMPNASLRERFVNSWHKYILSKLSQEDIAYIVKNTEGQSFAWLESVKSELFKQIVNNQSINAAEAVKNGKNIVVKEDKKVGFASK